MKFQIKHRFTTSILFECEADSLKIALELAVKSKAYLGGADLRCADLGGANLGDANLRGADLRCADLGDANLRGADLGDAYLRDANLRGADLGDADLRGAYLRDAYLGGAYLQGQTIVRHLPVSDPRGYFSWAYWKDGEWRIVAGCRNFNIEEAREHWGDSYEGDRDTADQYLYAINWLEKQPKPEESK